MKITYSQAIVKDVRKIKNQKLITAVEEAINEIKAAGELKHISNIKRLKGHPSAYRIRIGDYRLGFYYQENVVVLARFVKRNDIYKLFP